MRQRKPTRRRTRRRRARSVTRKSMGRGARLCRDAENCDDIPVSRIETTRRQLATTENSIAELDRAIRGLDGRLHARRSHSVASHASARSKRTPGAGKEGNKSALQDFKRAKMADRDIEQLEGQRANMEGQRRMLLRTAKNLQSEIAFDRAQREAEARLQDAHAAAESALREAMDMEDDLPSTASSVDSEEAERMLADRPPTPLTPGEEALLAEINFGSDSDGQGVRRTRRRGKSRHRGKSRRKGRGKKRRTRRRR